MRRLWLYLRFRWRLWREPDPIRKLFLLVGWETALALEPMVKAVGDVWRTEPWRDITLK